jgi:hypothetical protein
MARWILIFLFGLALLLSIIAFINATLTSIFG